MCRESWTLCCRQSRAVISSLLLTGMFVGSRLSVQSCQRPESVETETRTLFPSAAQGRAHLNALVWGNSLIIIPQPSCSCGVRRGWRRLRGKFQTTSATFVCPLKSRLRTISLWPAAGCDWDYSGVHVQPRRPPGLRAVGGLLNSADDKVACQTGEKANRPDSGSIYILLCNSLDLF